VRAPVDRYHPESVDLARNTPDGAMLAAQLAPSAIGRSSAASWVPVSLGHSHLDTYTETGTGCSQRLFQT